MEPFELAGGRSLPPLLFVSTPEALAQFNVSEASLRAALPAPHHLLLIPKLERAAAAADAVRNGVPAGWTPEGVVLLGNYDTLRAQLVRTYSEDLKPDVSMQDEDDHYVAWNDDHFGDRDDDGFPELPVSRIPSGVDLRRALRATPPDDAPDRPIWRGFRIEKFAYAEAIYNEQPDAQTSAMLTFKPDTAHLVKQNGIAADRVFYATHADYGGIHAFKTFDGIPVVKAAQVPDADGSIVLASCCYSATLVRNGPLAASTSGTVVPLATPESMGLTYVHRGARAFIGFTAKVWVPDQIPYAFFAGPLHRAFWKNVLERDLPPARALFEAKGEFILGMPYGNPDVADGELTAATSLAKHLKDYWSVTCLGLGW